MEVSWVEWMGHTEQMGPEKNLAQQSTPAELELQGSLATYSETEQLKKKIINLKTEENLSHTGGTPTVSSGRSQSACYSWGSLCPSSSSPALSTTPSSHTAATPDSQGSE